MFPFPAKCGRYRAAWRNHNCTCWDFEYIFWKAVMHYAPPTCCLRCLKDPSHSTTQHRKPDVCQTILNKYFKIISLMTLKGKIFSDFIMSKKTLRGLIVLLVVNSAVLAYNKKNSQCDRSYLTRGCCHQTCF